MRIVGGALRGRTITAPRSDQTRPSSERLREALFNICFSVDGMLVLDLFAGSGAVAFEALSRGAAHATLVERDRRAIRAIQKNADDLGLKGATTLLPTDIWKALEQLERSRALFDLIFCDPPYGVISHGQLLERCEPLMSESATLFLEEGAPLEISSATLEIKSERRIGPAYLYQLKRRSSA